MNLKLILIFFFQISDESKLDKGLDTWVWENIFLFEEKQLRKSFVEFQLSQIWKLILFLIINNSWAETKRKNWENISHLICKQFKEEKFFT